MVPPVGLELGRALLLADAVTPEAMAQALLASVRDRICLVRALLATDAIDPSRLEEELARTAPDAPLQQYPTAVQELVERLPPHLCGALLALPVRRDPMTGTVDVALADAYDTHAAEEIAFYLDAPVRVVRSPLGAMEAAIMLARRQSSNPPSSGPISVPPPSPVRPMAHTPPWGSPILVAGAHAHVDERPAAVSERPIPLVPRTPSEQVPPNGDIPIPLYRRLTPGAGLVALSRAAVEDDDEDPVVELRRTKPPSRAPSQAAPPVSTTPLPAATLHQLLREMTKATARDPLMELVLVALRPFAGKAALFAVKKDAYVGWMCTPEFGDRGRLGAVRIEAHVASIFSTLATVGTYVGPLLRNDAHAPLFGFVRSQRPEIIGASIKAAGKPAVIVLAHDVAEPPRAMNALTDVARVAGESLERILRAKR
jgi:hypothetical protein